jgi:beta-glucosidase
MNIPKTLLLSLLAAVSILCGGKLLLGAQVPLTAHVPSGARTSPGAQTKMDGFISALMQKMTLQEKIGQLNLVTSDMDLTGPFVRENYKQDIQKGKVGGIFNAYTPAFVKRLQDMAVKGTRLHIPLLFGYDVIHGHKTIFPIPLGLSCTWDTALIRQSARMAAEEASADGLNWTFSPMVDISRDPRWGRISEGAGEDPYYGAQVARAMVEGYQGSGLGTAGTIMACVKHFALYGAVEAGRDYNTVDMSRLRMYGEYFPPYKAAIDAGAGSVMSSFNEVDGIPATGNHWLMTEVLRRQWGFKGFVVTDYNAIDEMVAHGMGDTAAAGALALKAGIDMDMMSSNFVERLSGLLKQGKVTLEEINTACRRVLEAKYKLGLFDDPYRYINEQRAAREIMSPDKLEAARRIARESLVLLKNKEQTLPLKTGSTIALVGPLADDHRDMIGSWSAAGDWEKSVSIMEGIRQAAGPATRIIYAKGANLVDDSSMLQLLNAGGAEIHPDSRSPGQLVEEAVSAAKQADVVVAVLGESEGMTGEASSRTDIGLLPNQQRLLRALAATGKPVVLVLMNGHPLTLPWEDEQERGTAAGLLYAWPGGPEIF